MSEEKKEMIQEQDNTPEQQEEVEKPAIGLKDGELEINSEDFLFDEGDKEEQSEESESRGREQEFEAEDGKEEEGDKAVRTEADIGEEEKSKSPKDYPDTIEENGVTKYKVVVQGEVQYVPLEELIKGYQRQSDYTKKTQKLSEEKKKLQEEKQKIEEILKTVELQAQYKLTADELKAVVEQADNIVKSQYGLEDYDENYETIKSAIVTELANEIKAKKEAEQKFLAVENYLKEHDENYEAISALAIEIYENELPLAQVKKLQAARAKGDPMPFLDLYRLASERFYAQKQKSKVQEKAEGNFFRDTATPEQDRTQPKPKVEPPVVEGGYGAAVNESKRPRISVADLRGKSTADQAKLLVELGLV